MIHNEAYMEIAISRGHEVFRSIHTPVSSIQLWRPRSITVIVVRWEVSAAGTFSWKLPMTGWHVHFVLGSSNHVFRISLHTKNLNDFHPLLMLYSRGGRHVNGRFLGGGVVIDATLQRVFRSRLSFRTTATRAHREANIMQRLGEFD